MDGYKLQSVVPRLLQQTKTDKRETFTDCPIDDQIVESPTFFLQYKLEIHQEPSWNHRERSRVSRPNNTVNNIRNTTLVQVTKEQTNRQVVVLFHITLSTLGGAQQLQ